MRCVRKHKGNLRNIAAFEFYPITDPQPKGVDCIHDSYRDRTSKVAIGTAPTASFFSYICVIQKFKMKKNIEKIVHQISDILVAGIDARQVYLFGSYANNTSNKESDIDIFVVADLNGKKKIEITQQARRLLLKKIFFPVDILVCDIHDFNKRKDNLSTFEYSIATEGQKIYG